ncbi:hypothetical protein F1D05_09985 [Kribbella qitaiheensis]|uniref:Uncharacterized protein n=1 Tax=Kribbella qitaiheensis TaxID=1544730 RepID=A0A7G6WVZ6_9ACTN|nr:hypothetical protein [Kribbella qitaiheensis]QNE18161.1 hypothetical protein F1D05_09985 [Kribbella qitaiheensis]
MSTNTVTTTANRTAAGLIALLLPVSLDGETWHKVAFEGESASYVDRQAASYVVTHRDRINIGIDENTDWAAFPTTFNALCVSTPVYAVEYQEA